MSDAFTPYEKGLREFQQRLGKQHERLLDFLNYEHQLRTNIQRARDDGETPILSADRNRIVRQLNALALETVETSFNEICGLGRHGPVLTIPIEPPDSPLSSPAAEPSPDISQPPTTARQHGCIGRIGSRVVGLRVWYGKLPPAPQVAIIVALIGLVGTLGAAFIRVIPELFSGPTPIAAITATPTSTVTPTSTCTPSLAPTLTMTSLPTPTHTPTPTMTPTPTPDCRDIRVSYLKLFLVDSSGQPTTQRYPARNGEIVIAPSQIDRLENLQGQAVLTGTNVADCTCYWKGKTDVDGTPQPVNSLAEDCAFSIDLPDQVMAIHLVLTVGGDSGPTTIFVVRVREQ